jgi:hypothetical protein
MSFMRHADVDDEEVMLEEVLQDLKGSLVSNVNQTLFILGKARRCTCHCGHATVDQRSVGATWAHLWRFGGHRGMSTTPNGG